ncbi:probable G-protein coupled receptor 139 [Scyliorhinus canicula]|uniref:probable G-protein coupled receptor 139 n=1 Tax=Scyliorhinus canicula TaxID=7830 RepID=UPI0018F61924|nr:probable G-protein coupled receptor 139 [Scyliorhinus canicula]
MDIRLFLLMISVQEYFYYTLVIIGIPANFVTIVILCRGKCGLSKSITLYLLAMAVSDLLVIAFWVVFEHIAYYYVKSLIFFPTSICAVNNFLNSAFMDCSVWSTVVFTIDRFVAICHPGFKAKYCTLKTALAVLGTIWMVSILRSVPDYFKYEPIVTMEGRGWGCRVKIDFVRRVEWVTFDWMNQVLTPLIPYVVILLCNCLTVKHVLAASLARSRLRNQSKTDSGDPEVINRRKSIILLFSISASFILLWMPNVIYFMLDRIAKLYYSPANFTHPLAIFLQTSNMLMLLSSCVNTFIYALTQTKFRKQLWNGLTFPFSVIIRLVKIVKR